MGRELFHNTQTNIIVTVVGVVSLHSVLTGVLVFLLTLP